jgi:hypothetical protein
MPTNPITNIPSYSAPKPTPPPGSEESWYLKKLLPGDFAQGMDQYMQKPSIDMGPGVQVPPELQKSRGKAMGPVLSGVMKGSAEMLDTVNTPLGLGALIAVTATTGMPPSLVTSAIKAGIGVGAIYDAASKVPQAKEAFESGNTEEGVRLLTHVLPDLGAVLPMTTINADGVKLPEALTSGAKRIATDEGGFAEYRTPGGRRTTVTNPMKQHRLAEGGQLTEVPPVEMPAKGEVPQLKPPKSVASAAEPPAAAPAAASTLSIMDKHRMMQDITSNPYLDEATKRAALAELWGAPSTPAQPSPDTAWAKENAPSIVKAAEAKLPSTPTLPSKITAAEPINFEQGIADVLKSTPKVELTQAELGTTGGSGKKQPPSYVGKTATEKYSYKGIDSAGKPVPKANEALTPSTPEELNNALDALERGEGRPVNIVRRGLGDAKTTKGTLLYNVLDPQGRPTTTYAYMPDNYSGDPFPIKIGEVMMPNPSGKVHEMNVPRHAQRTYDLGMEISVPRKAEVTEGQRVKLPDGALGTHVEDVPGGPREVEYYKKNLQRKAASGDSKAIADLEAFNTFIAKKGYPTLSRVKMDDGRWVDFMPEELTKVETAKPSNSTPSTQIKPETQKARIEVEQRMSAAGGKRAQPAKKLSMGSGLGEPEQPVKRLAPTVTYDHMTDAQLSSARQSVIKQIKDLKAEAQTKKDIPQEVSIINRNIDNLRKNMEQINFFLDESSASERSKYQSKAIEPIPPPTTPPPLKK